MSSLKKTTEVEIWSAAIQLVNHVPGFTTAWDVENFPWKWIIFIQEIIVSFDKN